MHYYMILSLNCLLVLLMTDQL